MAGDATTVDDFMVAHARDFNCLADEDRTTRKRALQKLSSLPSTQPPDVLAHAWEAALRVPVLKAFADPVEKNRELAVALATELFAGVCALPVAAYTLEPAGMRMRIFLLCPSTRT